MDDAIEAFYLGADPGDPSRLLWLPLHEGKRHCLCTGASGTGKSSWAHDQIMQRIAAGDGVVVIDPKGDLVRDILATLSMIPESEWPPLAKDVVIIDPSDSIVASAFNPLELSAHGSPSRQRQDVLSVLRRIFEFDDARTARLILVLRRSLQLAIEHGLTLVDVPRLLADASYRDGLVSRSSDEDVRRFWLQEFPTGRANQQQWASSALIRLEALLDDPAIRRFFGRRRSTFDFGDILNSGKVALISLAKGALGEETSRLLGGFLLGRLQLAAEGRVNLPSPARKTSYWWVDEVQNYATSSLSELLAEARGYGVSITMMHQNLSQLPQDVRDAALSNANLRVAFRVSAEDAAILAKEYFLVSGTRVKSKWWNVAALGPLPIPYPEYKFFSPAEEARQNRELLHQLPDRHMLLHRAGEAEPALLRTVDLPLAEMAASELRVQRLKHMLGEQHRGDESTEPAHTEPAAAASNRAFEWRRPAARSTHAQR
jgi:hypothetical protein